MKKARPSFHAPVIARVLLVLLCVPAPALAQHTAGATATGQGGTLVLRHATLLDGVDTLPRRDVAITIRDGRIVSVDRDETARVAATDSVVDLKNAWVVPGLIDAHVHVGLDAAATMGDNVRAAQWALMGGATTIRFAGVAEFGDVALRDLFLAGEVPLPRPLPAGRALTPLVSEKTLSVLPGLQRLLTPATPADSALRLTAGPAWRLTGNPAALDSAVAILAAHGAEWVKVFATGRAGLAGSNPRAPLFTENDMREVVLAARSHGMWVEAHAHGDGGIRSAVRAGVRTIEHGTYASDTTLRLMLEHGTCLVPTLSFWDELGKNPDSTLRANATTMRAAAEDAVRRARALGVPVIAGTDNQYVPRARQIGAELRALAHAGLSPSEVLLAATSRSARCLEQGGRLGAVAPGHAADLLVLEGDPRANLDWLGAPRLVIVSGRVALDRR